MKAACPACGAVFSLDALLGNEGAREAVMAALAMPAPLGKIMVQYLGMFRPAKRQLSFDRVANLLNELLPLIRDAKITRGGMTHSAPLDYWKMGLEEMLAKRDTLTLPLKSHGYLLTIIAGYSAKAEARKEQQHEDRLAGRTPVGYREPETGNRKQETASTSSGQAAKRAPMPQSIKDILKQTKGE